jgi:hypothetical protein
MSKKSVHTRALPSGYCSENKHTLGSTLSNTQFPKDESVFSHKLAIYSPLPQNASVNHCQPRYTLRQSVGEDCPIDSVKMSDSIPNCQIAPSVPSTYELLVTQQLAHFL